jgi:hypothetical protein
MKSQKIRAEALLEKLAKQTDGAEIYELRTVELPVRFRAGALESVKAVETAGRALRLIKDGRLDSRQLRTWETTHILCRMLLSRLTMAILRPFAFPHSSPLLLSNASIPRSSRWTSRAS